MPNVCTIECRNSDADDLFPKGTINQACVERCRDINAVSPPSPGVRPSGNNRAFVLLEPMVYEIGSTGITIEVPAGFVTDYASIPKSLWSLYSPHDQYSRAAIIHDYLYWSQTCKREQADNLFMIAMKESEVPAMTREIVYRGVTTFGNTSWIENRKQREKKMPRVVPTTRTDFPPNWSWEMYRKFLEIDDVEDPPFVKNDYCSLGNNSDIPIVLEGSPVHEKRAPKNPHVVERAAVGMDAYLFDNALLGIHD